MTRGVHPRKQLGVEVRCFSVVVCCAFFMFVYLLVLIIIDLLIGYLLCYLHFIIYLFVYLGVEVRPSGPALLRPGRSWAAHEDSLCTVTPLAADTRGPAGIASVEGR